MDHADIKVIKNTGEADLFNEGKLRKSLISSGADPDTIDTIVKQVTAELYDGMTTKAIYQKAHQTLKKKEFAKASRYKLKNAILELGPTGYPFELFVGELLKCLGYAVQVGINIHGKCVTHEVDVLAESEKDLLMVECKFHNRLGYRTDVKVPLYIDSRFRDLSFVWKQNDNLQKKKLQGGVVTNARLTLDAITYGECAGLKMLSWDYPESRNLKTLVDQYRLYPITSLQHLAKTEKKLLIDEGIVVVKTLRDNFDILGKLSLGNTKYQKVVREVNLIYES